jgi:integrase/recombinase XerC
MATRLRATGILNLANPPIHLASPAYIRGFPDQTGWDMQEADQNWIQRFLSHLHHERRYSPHTISNYNRDLSALLEFCKQQDIQAWQDLGGFQIRQFTAAGHRKGLSPRSLQRQLSTVRSFFRYLNRERVVKANPAVEVRAPKAPKRLPKTMDVDMMGKLLEMPRNDPLAIRDWAVMELLYSSGLRLAELVNLDMTDVDLSDRTVRVTGKGNKTRIVPLGRFAGEALAKWLQQRGGMAGAGSEHAMFLSQQGRRISHRSVQARVKLWARRQGLPVEVNPHLFRHSFASHLLESSGDLRGVQELLGHADISTTQIYTHLDFQHLARIYDGAHPRSKRRR